MEKFTKILQTIQVVVLAIGYNIAPAILLGIIFSHFLDLNVYVPLLFINYTIVYTIQNNSKKNKQIKEQQELLNEYIKLYG